MSLSDFAASIVEPKEGECRQAIANAFCQEFEMDKSAQVWIVAALNGSVDAALLVLKKGLPDWRPYICELNHESELNWYKDTWLTELIHDDWNDEPEAYGPSASRC